MPLRDLQREYGMSYATVASILSAAGVEMRRRGPRGPHAKNAERDAEIRRLRAEGVPAVEVARRYGLSAGRIPQIVHAGASAGATAATP